MSSKCETCGTECLPPDEDSLDEAADTFRPEELRDASVVCEDCWQLMRSDMPELDARYAEQGR